MRNANRKTRKSYYCPSQCPVSLRMPSQACSVLLVPSFMSGEGGDKNGLMHLFKFLFSKENIFLPKGFKKMQLVYAAGLKDSLSNLLLFLSEPCSVLKTQKPA